MCNRFGSPSFYVRHRTRRPKSWGRPIAAAVAFTGAVTLRTDLWNFVDLCRFLAVLGVTWGNQLLAVVPNSKWKAIWGWTWSICSANSWGIQEQGPKCAVSFHAFCQKFELFTSNMDLWWLMMTYDDLCHLMSTFFCKWQIPRLSNGRSLWTQTTESRSQLCRLFSTQSRRAGGVMHRVNSLAKRSTRHQRMKLRECLPFLWLSHLQFVSYDVKCNYRNYLHNVVLTLMCRHHHIIYIISYYLWDSFVRKQLC